LEHLCIRLLRGVNDVSIPERVWGGLERGYVQTLTTKELFQSLRGFGVGWSAKVCDLLRWNIQVSIPERVWGGLEPLMISGASLGIRLKVSIPERVWGGLERTSGECPIILAPVSIPERVWGGLELCPP